jgi:hypothetical protein
MLLLNLNKIRTAQERFEQVYQPASSAGPGFHGRGAGLAGVRYLQGQAAVPAGRRRADDARAAVRPVPRAVHAPVDQTFDLRYHPHAKNTGEGEKELEDDDLTTAFYENDEIDLGHLMQEQFYLSLPMKPLCPRRLQGAVRGLRREPDNETCACKRDWEDPRLAALKKLKAEKLRAES